MLILINYRLKYWILIFYSKAIVLLTSVWVDGLTTTALDVLIRPYYIVINDIGVSSVLVRAKFCSLLDRSFRWFTVFHASPFQQIITYFLYETEITLLVLAASMPKQYLRFPKSLISNSIANKVFIHLISSKYNVIDIYIKGHIFLSFTCLISSIWLALFCL